ncbi:MAG: glycosyltransferase [Verrucomicrobiota bacterium]
MQRVRLISPYLREQGIEAEVLCVEPDQVAAPQDSWLAAGLPQNVLVHRVKALDLKWGKLPGLGTLTFRALGALRRRGDELLGRKVESGKLKAERGDQRAEFDLVYFSTTQFGVHGLGPRWKKKFGVPFVMDYQDPWVSDYYREHPEVVPPGGRLKYGLASWINRRQEPRVLRECSGITSVSAAYPEQLVRRYGGEEIGKQKVESRGARWTGAIRDVPGQGPAGGRDQSGNGEKENAGEDCAQFQLSTFRFPLWSSSLFSTVLPFPGDARDFERVRQEGIRQSVFDPNDGLKHWVYVGRGGADMALAVRALFCALANEMQRAKSIEQKRRDVAAAPSSDPMPHALCPSPPNPMPHAPCLSLSNLRLHFIGTSYAGAGQGMKTIEPLAREFGLEGIVSEHPDRIPYSETLRCLLDADTLIIPGSDDPGYTASKIYPYLLAEKPLLAVFHEQSSVVDLIRKVGGGTVISFATGEAPNAIAARIASEWLAVGGPEHAVSLDQTAFAPYTAMAQAANLADLWHRCLIARSS